MKNKERAKGCRPVFPEPASFLSVRDFEENPGGRVVFSGNLGIMRDSGDENGRGKDFAHERIRSNMGNF